MVKIQIKNTKKCEIINQTEDIYCGEHKASNFHIELPKIIGANYKINECTLEMRIYFPNNTYFLYNINTNIEESLIKKIPITNEITDTAQELKIMFIFKKDNEVIGKTNFINIDIKESCNENENPLTPRAEFDEKIREQRETIERQEETITRQQGTITEQGEQITELNGEVTELQGEVAEQAATITRQNTTIDQLNSRVPLLDTPKPVNPSLTQQTIRPTTENAIGLTQVVVNGATTEDVGINPAYYKEGEPCIDKVGSYAPFKAVGGIFVVEEDEDGYPTSILVKNYRAYNPFPRSWSASALTKIEFDNCPNITSFSTSLRPFNGMRTLRTIILSNGITTFGAYDFADCTNLIRIHIPNSLQTIASPSTVFNNCSTLEYVTIENGFNCNSLNLAVSTRYSHDTILSWFNALADRTGKTAYTLTIGTTNLNKMTAEEKAIATNKNWNLA